MSKLAHSDPMMDEMGFRRAIENGDFDMALTAPLTTSEAGVYVGCTLIADVSEAYHDHGLPKEMQEAYARLFAAASVLQAALKKLLGDIDSLIAESGGVCGLHRNGDDAPWSELVDDGRFGDWLPLEHARAALKAAKEQS